MTVGSKHNQPKARPKGKKTTTRRNKIIIAQRKRKNKKPGITDHNQKPIHNKHTIHYLITVKNSPSPFSRLF